MDGHELIAFEVAQSRVATNAKRHNRLMMVAVAGKVLLIPAILLMVVFDLSMNAKIYTILGGGGIYLVALFTMMVVWSEPGNRWRTVKIIGVFLLLAAVVAAVGPWLIMQLLNFLA